MIQALKDLGVGLLQLGLVCFVFGIFGVLAIRYPITFASVAILIVAYVMGFSDRMFREMSR